MALPSDLSRRRFLHATGAAAGSLFVGSQAAGQNESELHVCPRSNPPARKISAMRLEELTSHNWDMRLTLTCLQGLVNRSQPRLFLVQDRYDDLWLEWLKERGDVDQIEWLDVGQIFGRFLPEVQAGYITDPSIPASVNVATMLAGARGGLVATPATAAQYNLPMGALPDSWRTGLDLRTLNWKKDVDAYRWAFHELDSELSRRAVCYLDPLAIGLRDYLVQFKIPIVWLSAPSDAAKNPQASFEEEKAFVREMFMKWPANIPCFGWPGDSPGPESGIGEWQGVKIASECGKFEVCSAYDGFSPTVSNLSVHSGTKALLHQSKPAPLTLDRAKIYVSFARSDGDGMNFLRHYYRKLFDDPQHGSVPMGWQVGPTAADLMPDILDYYYQHARPGDYFTNALTGVGYIHEDVYADNFPPEQRERILEEFIRLSGIYRARLDTRVLTTFAEMRPARLARLASINGIESVMANYGRTHLTTSANLVSMSAGKPVFRSVNHGPGELTFTPYARREAEVFMINDIRRNTPSERPAFLHVFLANWLTHMEMAENIAKGLGPEYVFVRPDQLLELFKQK